LPQSNKGANDLNTGLNGEGLFKTEANITAPYSVKAKGNFRRPPQPELDVANCDFKFRLGRTASVMLASVLRNRIL
jgi:hypothetical protein